MPYIQHKETIIPQVENPFLNNFYKCNKLTYECECYRQSLHELARGHWQFMKGSERLSLCKPLTSPKLDHCDGKVQQVQKFAEETIQQGVINAHFQKC